MKSGQFTDSNDTAPIGNQNADPVKFNVNNNLYSVFGDSMVLYELTVSNDSINRKGSISTGMPYGGGLFISNDIILTMIANGTDAKLIEYNISDNDNIIEFFNQTIANISVGGTDNDMIYVFPALFIKDGTTLKSLLFEPSEFNSSNNVKPRINNLEASPSTTAINQTSTISYTVDNPETNWVIGVCCYGV